VCDKALLISLRDLAVCTQRAALIKLSSALRPVKWNRMKGNATAD
jgi:hypothetical protein